MNDLETCLELVEWNLPNQDQVQTLSGLVNKNQNRPPEGAADSSMNEQQWVALRDIRDSMQQIQLLFLQLKG